MIKKLSFIKWPTVEKRENYLKLLGGIIDGTAHY